MTLTHFQIGVVLEVDQERAESDFRMRGFDRAIHSSVIVVKGIEYSSNEISTSNLSMTSMILNEYSHFIFVIIVIIAWNCFVLG